MPCSNAVAMPQRNRSEMPRPPPTRAVPDDPDRAAPIAGSSGWATTDCPWPERACAAAARTARAALRPRRNRVGGLRTASGSPSGRRSRSSFT